MGLDEVFHGVMDHGIEIVARLPAEESAGFGDVGDAAVAILVAFTIKRLAADFDDFGMRISGPAEMLVEDRDHAMGEPPDRGLVLRCAEIEDLAISP